MIRAHCIHSENIDSLRPLYERFQKKALSDYHWTFAPLDFETLKIALTQGPLRGYWLEDFAAARPVAFMLYCWEPHQVIEINLVYTEINENKVVLDQFLRTLIQDVREKEGWEVISYAMLGCQAEFVRTIPWYGFKLVGQAILNFDLSDLVSIQILRQQNFPPLDADYRLDQWRSEYASETVTQIFESFSKGTDALWDTRFRTMTGAEKVLAFITEGYMGRHLPSCTSVLLKNNHVVGFCFLIQDSMTSGNIPLVGVHANEKGRGFGNHLLQHCLNACVQGLLAEENTLLKISTTTDTDNIPAIHMYRRMGFREQFNYPHAYLTREKALAFQPGKWC